MPIMPGCGGGARSVAARSQSAVPERLGGEHAEQVEVGGFLILEEAHLVPGVLGAAEPLVPAVGLEQAHGPRDLLVDRVRGARDIGHVDEIGEDRGHGQARLARRPSAPYRAGATGSPAARPPLTAPPAPVSLPSGPAGAARAGWSTGAGADGGAGAWGGAGVGAWTGIGIAESGPVELVSGGATVGGAGGAGAAGGTWAGSGMPRLTGEPVVPVVPVPPASADGAGATADGGNWGVGATGWSGGACWYPAAGAGWA